MIINTNVAALFSQRMTHNAEQSMETAMERLSSGKRVNRASDDAAGAQIAECFSSQIMGAAVATRNTNDAISVVQVHWHRDHPAEEGLGVLEIALSGV